jgi:hypothetical protein
MKEQKKALCVVSLKNQLYPNKQSDKFVSGPSQGGEVQYGISWLSEGPKGFKSVSLDEQNY